ncbi:N-6 DNA methylase [Streptomyces violascens]|uniref:Type II restriction endonuclease subunit M n=1 Tax=Streptomyces violascens TaxID=67381 RepID=A0ABQ3QLY1_9ACTN|nr:N-6 DNA methylase [Streptomyces violascens]GGT98350.1 type II restriction endonuclease subunit M [Streptomyces violascens]GHI38282.1 type II restriction endonuclease subunit M [Streptomyces violascens]
MPEHAAEVTAATIARLAGVGRAAVSNWRRRHADFPKPVGGTETSPSFALHEVEQWLRAQGKLAEVPLRERVWQQLSAHPAGAVTALVHAGCALLAVRDHPAKWRKLAALSDAGLAEGLPGLLGEVLGERFKEADPAHAGHGRSVNPPDAAELAPSLPLLRGVAELAAEAGAREAFEFLLGRHLDANPRQYTLTPQGPAELMAALAGPAGSVLDPACGTGTLLCALPDAVALHGQDADPDLAALTGLRLALAGSAAIRTAAADSLRADAFGSLAADAVLCHPPFNERAWGHDELAYDPRWEYGLPARTESELAWVQHALARLREGGTAVLLMPPAAASRRSGRRIRADLLRRGALRAVVALPAGAAPPYGIPLHLWVLRRPDGATRPAPELLLVDTGGVEGVAVDGGRDRLPWPALQSAVLDAWTPFDRDGTAVEQPGVSRSVPVIELLDDDVDLAPARHLPPPAAEGGTAALDGVRERLDAALRLAAELTPPPAAPAPAQGARWSPTTVGELARAGALVLRAGGAGSGPDGPAVLTEHDVLAGTAPSGTLPEGPAEEPVLTRPGDVVVPVLGGGTAARVVDEASAGAALGRNLQLLRPEPAALDPWFLAGFLRGTANNRQASSYATTASRLDVRRLHLPRLPLAEQRRYGERFRALAAFEDTLRLAGRLGEQLVQGLHDGLTDGSVGPG